MMLIKHTAVVFESVVNSRIMCYDFIDLLFYRTLCIEQPDELFVNIFQDSLLASR